jgi:hypothetical protein
LPSIASGARRGTGKGSSGQRGDDDNAHQP